ncbi:unnamed protein product [Phytophthora lilii]|uniref:Unnamed protein product n=1 Tax=Phytophthora lilii TaxID=2077276 RepID=A0A9W6U562_9STRA|nr:unnamed protein product [Phytophthora lilii]
MWLLTKKNPEKVFKKMRLGAAGEVKADDSVIRWLEYVTAYRQKMGGSKSFTDHNVYELLYKAAPGKELALLFSVAERDAELKAIWAEVTKCPGPRLGGRRKHTR